MDNGFSILMLIFGAAVMLYAAILSSGNYKLLPLTVQPSLRRKDKKAFDLREIIGGTERKGSRRAERCA